MRERVIAILALHTLALVMLLNPKYDPLTLGVQAILCCTLAASFITSLRHETENFVLAGGIFVSIAALALLISSSFFGQARHFETFLVNQIGVAAGAWIAAVMARHNARSTHTGEG